MSALAQEVQAKGLSAVKNSDFFRFYTIDEITKKASNLVQKIAEVSRNPANILIPGGKPLADNLGKSAAVAGQGVKDAAGSAASGIKTGFAVGTGALLLLVGLFVWSQIRAAAGSR